MVRIGPVVSEEKMLTHDGRRTTHDDGRQPIAIGHLSDSGDLKKIGISSMYFRYFIIISPWKRVGPSFEQTCIPFTQDF